MKRSKEVIDSLNKLLILNCKTEKVFSDVLDEVDSIILKNFFRVATYQRKKFIKSLDTKIRKKGGIPTYPEEIFNSDNLQNSNLKKVIETKNEQLLLTEIGRIQITDIEKYQENLNDFQFSESIEKLLAGQQETMVKSLYAIEVHKDLFAKQTVA
jgi:Domain of unknown function (DUF2383)